MVEQLKALTHESNFLIETECPWFWQLNQFLELYDGLQKSLKDIRHHRDEYGKLVQISSILAEELDTCEDGLKKKLDTYAFRLRLYKILSKLK